MKAFAELYNVKALLIAALFIAALSSCALVPDRPDANTPEERLGEVHAIIAATANTTTNALEAGRIGADTAEDILDKLETVRSVADSAASAIAAGGDGDEQLRQAQSLLNQVEARLNEEVENE